MSRACGISVGIMAYNEEWSIGSVVARYLSEPRGVVHVDELILIASGCTDGTVAAATEAALGDTRLRVIEESERTGKVVAVKTFLQIARNDIVIISGGDTLPDVGALQHLCAPLVQDAAVGMAGPHVVPVGGKEYGRRLHHVLWELHHLVALRTPKLGEIVALRRAAAVALPLISGCDEVLMEAMVADAGLELVYTPAAVVRNQGPASVRDYVAWRYRLAGQHDFTTQALSYRPATARLTNRLRATMSLLTRRPGLAPWLVMCVLIEILAQANGRRASLDGGSSVVWEPTATSRNGALAA